MIFYPAIDLKEGNCVRLYQGDMKTAKIFNSNPANQAKEFFDAGASWLHLVDLDGAFAGNSVNGKAIEEILAIKPDDVKVQLGGGIRELEHIEKWLSLGIDRVILGTVALKKPELVIEAAKLFPYHIAVGIDAKDGYVAIEGWGNISDIEVSELAKEFEQSGVVAIIHTDISKDGAMSGPNLMASVELAQKISIPVIVSGGVSNYSDLEQIAKFPLLNGVISGKAIYENTIDVRRAIHILNEKRDT